MESVTPEIETTKSPLHTVTPLSKYLALGLFIILPFLGGWIGYMYALEKIIEVETVVEVEKKTTTVPFSSIDKKFYTDDISYLSAGGGVVFVLEGNTLFWESGHHGDGWSSTVVSNPDTLEYVAHGILTDGNNVYSITPDPGISSLVAEEGINVLKSDSIDLLINGQSVYGFHVRGPYASLSDEPIKTANPESVTVVGGNYFKDRDSVYHLEVFDDITEVKGADATSFQALELGFGADKNAVFYRHEKLEGVDPKVVTFTEGDYPRFMIAGDRAWAPYGGCDIPSYKEIPISELESYTHC